MFFTQNNWELNQIIFIKVSSAVVLSVAPTVVVPVAAWNLSKGFKLIWWWVRQHISVLPSNILLYLHKSSSIHTSCYRDLIYL